MSTPEEALLCKITVVDDDNSKYPKAVLAALSIVVLSSPIYALEVYSIVPPESVNPKLKYPLELNSTL